MRIHTRERIEKYLRTLRSSVSIQSNNRCDLDTIYGPHYIPSDLPIDLQALIKAVDKCLGNSSKKQTRIQDAYHKIMLAEGEYSCYGSYWRSRARLMIECKDHSAAHSCLDRAIDCEPKSLVSLRLKADLLLQESRISEAIAVFEVLREHGAMDPEKCGTGFASLSLGGYLHANIFCGNLDVVNALTNDWFKHKKLGLPEVVARIRCFRGWAENHEDPMHEKRFIHALNTFDSAIVEFGMLQPLESVCKELIEEICYFGQTWSSNSISTDYLRKCVEFIGRYLSDAANPGDSLWILVEKVAPKLHSLLALSSSPVAATASDVLDRYRKEGFQIATITNRAMTQFRTSTSFMFAVDENGDDYFLHLSCVPKSSQTAWRNLKLGSFVAVKRTLSEKGSAKWTATEIVPLNT